MIIKDQFSSPDEMLELWRSQDIEHIPIQHIKTDMEAFQPRIMENRNNKVMRQKERLNEMIKHIEHSVSVGRGAKDPIWLIEEGDKYFIVDGHHRFTAYRRQSQNTIPAKVYRGDDGRLIGRLVAGFANTQATSIQLLEAEAREACWLFLSELTNYGKNDLPKNWTTRKVSSAYGGQPSRTWVSRAVRKIGRIKNEHARSGKDWPSYQEACSLDRPDDGKPPPYDEDKKMKQKDDAVRAFRRTFERYPTDIAEMAYKEFRLEMDMCLSNSLEELEEEESEGAIF